MFVETVRVARGGGTIFGEASRGAHVEMHGGIRGLPVRRTVGGRDYERRRGEYRVRCRGEEARGELFFIQRYESVTREDERRHTSTALFPEIAEEETLFDVGNNKNQIYLQKGGGAAHFLFELTETDEWGVSSSMTTTSTSGKDELGTLEICWLGCTGEPGRLQTQPILAPKPSDTTPPQIMRGTSLGGGGEYSRPILRTTVEILNNEEDENVPNAR